MTHTERHEEVILNHIDGSLDEKNLDEALGLLRQCKECQEIYDNIMGIRSEFQQTKIVDYLPKNKKESRAVARSRYERWKAASRRPLLVVTILILAVTLPLGLWINKLAKELKAQERARYADKEKIASELGRITQENEKLKLKVKQLDEAKKSADLPQPIVANRKDSLRSAVTSSEPRPKSFYNPHHFALALSEIRGGEGSQTEPVLRIELPKSADLLHLTLSITEEKSYPSYRIAITADKNKTLLQRYEDVKKDRFGNFNLFFPRDFFKNKDYVIEVFGLVSGQPALISQQRIRVNVR